MATSSAELRVGVISDTHGLLRPEAVEALEGVDLIIHAGDVGAPEILGQLRLIAPTLAVRGNVDRGAWAMALPERDVVPVGDRLFYVLHDVNALDLDPAAAGFTAVISGHSHQPREDWRHGVLFLNPGSAGPRRFTLPVTLSILRVTNDGVAHARIDLAV